MVLVISIRPTSDISRKIEALSLLTALDRSSLIRIALSSGLDEELRKNALDQYRLGRISLGKAAEISGISVKEMMALLKKNNVILNVSVQDIQDDYQAAMKK
jgi:predicted HTH domain antitoxin